tara:strand:- start:1509 stop:2204 length:696 start_codon:yes stop_codon:yes gene_type:complete
MKIKDFLNQFKFIIFDLDGVILDSARLKVNAMEQALQVFNSELVSAFLKCFVKEFGQPRQYHFKNFYFNFLKESCDDFHSFYETYASRYAANLQQDYRNVPLCAYAEDLIRTLDDKKCFVATGTATEEAIDVLNNKQLTQFFDGIYGAPREKKVIIKSIIEQHNASPEQCILIGDAIHDRNSAFANQIPFLFIERYARVGQELVRQNSLYPFYVAESLDAYAVITGSEKEY